MENRLILILLLLCVKCSGQPVIIPFTVPVSGTVGPASFMPNLAEYWEFTKGGGNGINSVGPFTNAVVTNWFGQIQGTILTNGNASLRPTNSSSGIGFTGTQILTNGNLFLGSNWTISVFYQYTLNQLGGGAATLVGTNDRAADNHNFSIVIINGGAGKQNWQWTSPTVNGGALGSGNNSPIIGNVADFTMCNSNNANGGAGHSFFWTNGIPLVMGSTSAEQGINEYLSFVGSGPGGGNGNCTFGGFIQGIYVQTNLASDNINASNIHYYRTNFLTKGAAP